MILSSNLKYYYGGLQHHENMVLCVNIVGAYLIKQPYYSIDHDMNSCIYRGVHSYGDEKHRSFH